MYHTLYAQTILNGEREKWECEQGHFWKRIPQRDADADVRVIVFPRWNGVLRALFYKGYGS